MAASQLRRALLKSHSLLGIGLGLWFVVLGLTGSVLVYYLEIGHWLARDAGIPATSAPLPSPQKVLETLQALEPHRDGAWRIEWPSDRDAPIRARYYKPAERSEQHFAPRMVELSRDQLRPLRGYYWGEEALTWIYDLHYSLLLGSAGQTAVGWAGLALLLSCLSGLMLIAHFRKLWGAWLRLRVRQGAARALFDLHAINGLYAVTLLLVISLSGLALSWPQLTRTALQAITPLSATPSVRLSSPVPTRPRITLDDAALIARQRFPDAQVRWFESSSAAGSPVIVRLQQPGEPSRRFPQTYLWLHPANGTVLAIQDGLSMDKGRIFLAWMHPLHNGEAFGAGGRFLAFLSGLSVLVFFVTGWMRWRRKHRARKYQRRLARQDTALLRSRISD